MKIIIILLDKENKLKDSKNTAEKQKDPELVSPSQLKYIHLLAKERDIDKPTLKAYSQGEFKKESSKDLTKKEASQLIDKLLSIKPKEDLSKEGDSIV